MSKGKDGRHADLPIDNQPLNERRDCIWFMFYKLRVFLFH